MTVIKGIRALRYNPEKIADISRVVAPPYDVIDPELEDELLRRDPHNIVRITMGKTPRGGRSPQDYVEAARRLSAWRSEGVLMRDDEPGIYFVRQRFEVHGESVCRTGFIGGLLLAELGSGSVFPHERTMSGPTQDRLELIRACRAGLSQVFCIYSDSDGRCERFLQAIEGDVPLYEFRDDAGVLCSVSRMDDSHQMDSLKELLRDQTVCIADGHHRYETALAYRDEARAASASPGAAPQDYVAIFCVSVANAGLKVLPTHRLVKADGEFDEARLLADVRQKFTVGETSVGRAADVRAALATLVAEGAEIGCYLPGGRLFGLRSRNAASSVRDPDQDPDMHSLPVCILNEKILCEHFDVETGRKRQRGAIRYEHIIENVYRKVEDGSFHAGFLLPAIEPRMVERVARSGQRLPPKSTFFYPKIPSGLVIYPFE